MCALIRFTLNNPVCFQFVQVQMTYAGWVGVGVGVSYILVVNDASLAAAVTFCSF